MEVLEVPLVPAGSRTQKGGNRLKRSSCSQGTACCLLNTPVKTQGPWRVSQVDLKDAVSVSNKDQRDKKQKL